MFCNVIFKTLYDYKSSDAKYNYEIDLENKAINILKKQILTRKVRNKLKKHIYTDVEVEDYLLMKCNYCTESCINCLKNCSNIKDVQDFLDANINKTWYE